MHAWVNYRTLTTALNDNRVIVGLTSSASTGMAIGIDSSGATPAVVRVNARSLNGDGNQGLSGNVSLPANAWVSIGGVLNFAAATLTTYARGLFDTTAAAMFSGSTYAVGSTGSPDSIGCQQGPPPPTASQLDGLIGEVSIWRQDIGADAFWELGQGISAVGLSAASDPAFYMPMTGEYGPELDIIGGSKGTITGSVPAADHPPIITPYKFFDTKIAGSLTLQLSGGLGSLGLMY